MTTNATAPRQTDTQPSSPTLTTKQKFMRFLGSSFGFGLLKPAPGTWGTLPAIPIAWALSQASPFTFVAVFFLIFALAVYIAHSNESLYGKMDASHFTLDEILGYLVAISFLPFTWQTALIGFLLFRLFDAWKPGPIGMLDRKVKGALGVILDDLAAGLVANIILQILFRKTFVLGVQLIQ